MKILHFILGKADKNKPNGVNQVISGLVKYLMKEGVNVKVFGKANTVDSEGEFIQRDGFTVEAFSKISLTSIGRLIDLIKSSDIVHLHGVYNFYNILVAEICIFNNINYIVTLHDGLSSVRMRQKRFILKKIFNVVFQKRFIIRASAVHVLTEEESTDLIQFGYSGRILLIPNGVDLEDFPYDPISKARAESKIVRIGYLGRLSPEKNIESLIKALDSSFEGTEIQLLLAGPSSSYLDSILVNNSNFCQIDYLGPIYGKNKIQFIESLDLFVHPAKCDVFSIAAMEVLALGTPLLITRTSNAAYFFNRNAFFMCEPTVYGIRKGIKLAIQTKNTWSERSVAGRELVESVFNWNIAALSMKSAYHDLKYKK